MSNSRIQLMLFSLFIVTFLGAILSPYSLTFADNVSLMVPGKIYTAHWLRQGIIPLWNPTLLGGLPWLADISQSIFYPSTLFFVLFKPAAALNLTILSHIFISAWGMHTLAKFWFAKSKQKNTLSVLAATLWIFSTQFFNAFNNITFLQSLVWMPWFVYFGIHIQKHTKYMWGVMGVVLLQLLGGYPVHVLYSGITAVVFSAYVTFSKPSTRTTKPVFTWLATWAGATLATLGVTAVVWVPFLDVLSNSTRTLQSDAQAVSGSLHPAEYIKLLIPYFFDNPKLGLRWGPGWNTLPNVSVYMPWIVFALSFFVLLQKKLSARIFFLIALVAVPLIFALGEYLPGYSLLRNIPLFSLTRGPSLILVISAFSLALLLPELINAINFKKISAKLSTALLIATAVFTTFTAILYVYSRFSFSTLWYLLNTLTTNAFTNNAFHTFERDQLIFTSISENMLVSSLSLFIVLFAFTKVTKNLKWVVIIAVLSLDLFYSSKAMLWFGSASIYNQESSLVAELPKDAQARYLIRNYNAPYTEYGSYWEAVYVRKPFSDSYVDTKEIKEFKHLQRMVDGLTPNMHMSYGFNSLNAYTTMVPVDVDVRWNPTEVVGINNVPEISATGPALSDWAVQYYLVDTFYPTTEDFSPHELVLEKELWKLYKRQGALPRIRYEDGTAVEGVIVETPNSISIMPQNHVTHSTITIADRFDPDWQATVNGHPIPIENHNGMRKIEVPVDTKELLLEYKPKSLYLGATISALCLAIALVAQYFYRTMKR